MSVTLQVHNPTGVIEVVQTHAPRLSDLNGRTIGELSNGVWDDQRTFPFLREQLSKRFHRACRLVLERAGGPGRAGGAGKAGSR